MNPETPLQSDPLQQGPVVNVLPEEAALPPAQNMDNTNPVNNKPNKVILTILFGIVAILLFVAVYLLLFSNKSVSTLGVNGQTIHIANNASTVQAQFMTDVFAGNMKGAYGLTSSNFQKSTSETNFVHLEKYLQVKELTTEDVKENVSANYTTISGNIEASGVHIFGYSSRLVKQGGIWKVNNIVIES